MNSPSRVLALAAAAALLTGCAAYSPEELNSFSRARVAPATFVRLERADPLDLADIIELSRRGIPATTIVRHLDRFGVDSVITRSDVLELRRSAVRAPVIDAALRASDRFAGRYETPEVTVGFGYDDYGWGVGPAWGF